MPVYFAPFKSNQLIGAQPGIKRELKNISYLRLHVLKEGLNDISQDDPRTVTDDIESMRHSLEQTNEELDAMGQAFHGFDATGLSEWMYDTRKTSLQVKESYLEQKIAFEDLMRSYEDGSISAEQFAGSARTASNEMELLNQQDMDKLNRTGSARTSDAEPAEQPPSTLEGLQDELDRLDGNTEAIERRRFEVRNRDLEQKLKQARSKGDGHSAANLQQALSLNQRVFNKTRDKRENEEREGHLMQLDTMTLPDNLLWVNEFDWTPVAQSTDRSLTGSLIVSESLMTYGRSIVLGDGENSWLTLADMNTLFALSEIPKKKMLLTLPGGRAFTVIFDQSEGAPIEARQVLPLTNPDDSDFYAVVIRLLTVAPG